MRIHKALILFFFLHLSHHGYNQEILFVGNSLTYTNNLPEILEDISLQLGKNVNTTSLCFPNYAIIDHLNEGKLQSLLKSQKFEYLIVQQGPSSQVEGRKMLIEDGALLKRLCEKHNIQLVYFMVWTSKAWFSTFDKVIENYSYAADINKAQLIPVGRIWKKFLSYKMKVNLYDSDRFHPSKAGSFLAALSLFHHFFPDSNLHHLDSNFYQHWVPEPSAFSKMLSIIENDG